jgi:hypothetical protein
MNRGWSNLILIRTFVKRKNMSAILIKSNNKAEENFILQFAKMIHANVKLLNNDEELDALLNKSKKNTKNLKLKSTVIHTASNSKTIQKFLENERQYGELF